MKIAIIGDIHLRTVSQFGFPDKDFYSTRSKQKIEVLNTITKYCISNKIDLVIFLGDIFDRINPSEKLSNLFVSVLMKFYENSIPIRIILGNHDYSASSTNLMSESLIFSRLVPNDIEVISDSMVELFNGVSLGYMPYLATKFPESSILFAHIDLQSAKFDNGMENTVGYSRNDLQRYTEVFLGHYHVPQEIILADKSTRITIVGSILKESFTATSIGNRFTIYDTDSLEITHIPIADRKYFLIKITEGIPIDLNVYDLKDSFVKLEFSGSRSWFSTTGKVLLDEIFQKKPYKVIQKYNLQDKSESSPISMVLPSSELLRQYLKNINKYSDTRLAVGLNYLLGDEF